MCRQHYCDHILIVMRIYFSACLTLLVIEKGLNIWNVKMMLNWSDVVQ